MNLYEIRYNKYDNGKEYLGKLYQVTATSEENALVSFGRNFGEIFGGDIEIDVIAIKLVRVSR